MPLIAESLVTNGNIAIQCAVREVKSLVRYRTVALSNGIVFNTPM